MILRISTYVPKLTILYVKTLWSGILISTNSHSKPISLKLSKESTRTLERWGKKGPNEVILLHLNMRLGTPWTWRSFSMFLVNSLCETTGALHVCYLSSQFFSETQDRAACSNCVAPLYTQSCSTLVNSYWAHSMRQAL